MDIDEVVETSDVEELEELYGGMEASRPPFGQESRRSGLVMRTVASSPPRKRIKIFHEDSSSPLNRSLNRLSVSPVKLSTLDYGSPLNSRSSSTAFNADSPQSLAESSRSPTQTPVEGFSKPIKQEREVFSQLDNSQDPFAYTSSKQPHAVSLRNVTFSPISSSIVSGDSKQSFRSPDTLKDIVHSQPQTPTRSPPYHLLQRYSSTTTSLVSTLPHTPSLYVNIGSPMNQDEVLTPIDDLEDDELLLFTPTKVMPQQMRSSPTPPTSNTASPVSIHNSPIATRSHHTPAPSAPLAFPSSSPSLSLPMPSPPRDAPPVHHTPAPSTPLDSPSSPPALPVPIPSSPPEAPPVDPTFNPADFQESRYSLRKRNIAQINPYTIEDLRYKRLLKSNPEAIVKLKAIERRHPHDTGNHYENEGETQQDVYADVDDGMLDEDASWEAAERKRLQLREERERLRRERESWKELSERDKIKYPEILQDLTDSDDGETDDLEKEARRVAKRMEKEEKAKLKGKQREKDNKIHKPKRFPVPSARTSSTAPSGSKHSYEIPDKDSEMGDSTKEAGPSRLRSQSTEAQAIRDYFDEYDDPEFDVDNRQPPSPSRLHRRRSSSPPPFNEGDTFPDIFGENDFDMHQGGAEDYGGVPDDGVPRSLSLAPSDSEEELGSREKTSSQRASSKVSDVELDIPTKKGRWLRKMYPESMIKELGLKGKAKKARRPPKATNEDEDTGPLLPGQSRIQKSTNPKDIREIKGDSESEVEDEPTRTPVHTPRIVIRHEVPDENENDSDVVEILETYRPRASKAVICVDEEFSSEDEIDDEDIQQLFFADDDDSKTRHASDMREGSLIDYMLTRCRNIGGERKKTQVSGRSKKRVANRSKSSKYKIDITTRGARGHARQTLLSFDKPSVSKKCRHLEESHSTLKAGANSSALNHPPGPSHHPDSSRSAGLSRHSAQSHRAGPSKHHRSHHTFIGDEDDDVDDDGDIALHEIDNIVKVPDHSAARRLAWKQKEKERRKRAGANGIWTTKSSGNKIITSGARKSLTTITVEEDEFQLEKEFQFALAPENHTQVQRENWSKQFIPPLSPPRRIRRACQEETHDELDDASSSKSPKKRYTLDMGVPVLPAGRNFGAATSIGKGWLYEMVNIMSGDAYPVRPLSVSLFGYSLDPEGGLQHFCAMLPLIFESFYEFVTTLPDPDQDITTTQWILLAHVVCQHISWYLKHGDEQGTSLLRETAEKKILEVTKKVEQLALDYVDNPVLALTWFTVEMAVRLAIPMGSSVIRPIGNLLKTSSAQLMNLLLQADLHKTMEPIRHNSALDGTESSHYAAELWVCLIQVFTAHVPKDVVGKPKPHPFWMVLLDVLRLRAEKETPLPVIACENVWFTIFSLCALSQYSTHGTVAGKPRLTACWDIVVYAFKRIRLMHAPGDSENEITKQRDAYIATVVKRCLYLHERWGWNLLDPSGMFNELAGIFRSRKFANLYGEGNDFPSFVRLTDWSLLSSSDPSDTTFTVFLKLIVLAAHQDPTYIQRKSSPKVKKWLSMAVPVGDVPLPKFMSRNHAQHNLSMFYNRIAAVAVAVELDPTEYEDRTDKARHYIDYARADQTTRFAIVRGIIYWSKMMVTRQVKVTAIVGWIENIATTIEKELKRCGPPPKEKESSSQQKERGYAVLFANSLIATVRQIIQSHIDANVYPEPSLIASLKPILTSWMKGTRQLWAKEFRLLGSTLFKARALVIPPASRPAQLVITPADEESQESQDFGVDDFGDLDWNAIELPEALAANPNDTGVADTSTKDHLLLQALEAVRFKWIITPFLRPYLQPPSDSDSKKVHEAGCDEWIRLFLCCCSLESQVDKWPECFRLLDKMLNVDCSDESWTSRVRLSIMYQLLKLDPMAYMIAEDRAIEAFLMALVSDHVALEKEYIAFFLSIAGLRHPLLHGVAGLPPKNENSGDFEFSTEEFLEVRMLLLRAIFENVNQLIHQHLRGNEDVILKVHQFIELIKKLFSTMRSRLNSQTKSTQKHDTYRDTCYRVYLLLKDSPELSRHEALVYWSTKWGPNLVHMNSA